MDGDIWAAFIIALIYIPIFIIWTMSLFDIFRRRDISGLWKAFWVLVIILLPLLGALIYIITRPVTEDDMARPGR